jgi:hypothetical protein
LQGLQTADFNGRGNGLLRKVASRNGSPRDSRESDLQADWRNVSIFRWRRDAEVAVVNYTAVSSRHNRSAERRQYWAREDGRWQLFFDGAV